VNLHRFAFRRFTFLDFSGALRHVLSSMHSSTADLRIRATKPLLAPAILEEEIPLDDARAALVGRTRREVAAIITGVDDRLLVVVGPCSIHDPVAALEYADRLAPLAATYAPDLLLVMRVYFEKPRTVVGWKGLINDPDRDSTFQINKGLRLARRLLADITGRGLPVGTEFLDTTLGQYYADLVSWGAIGARTVESQIHRELASGLSMPVGFKNRTDGDIQVAVDAIRSARHPHWFPSLTREGAPAVMGTTGNDHTHLVLRGGSRGPNYSTADIRAAAALLVKNNLPPHVMVDCSHANSGKDPARQPLVAAELAAQISAGEPVISSVMIESNLFGGAQDYLAAPLVYGRSITDACLAWEDTLPILATLATAVRARRAFRPAA
jgi:3-deoxy-7-phosphoheptulonate synthase